MFSIVQLTEGLELVCTKWIKEGLCLYPPFTSHARVNWAVESKETPGPKWHKYKVLRIFGTAESFKQGLQIVNLAMSMSEIDAECEEEDTEIKNSSRKKSNKKRTCCDSDEESGKRSQSSASSGSLSKLPRLSLDESETSDSFVEEVESDSENVSKFLLDFRKEVIYKLNKISERLSSIEDRLAGNCKDAVDQEKSPLDETFPLNSLNMLLEFEKKLLDADYYSKIVTALKSVGGRDLYFITTNILKRLVTDNVAELFSWSGQKKKMSFKDMLTVKVVLDAVRAHRPAVTETEISELISRWLVQAKQRISRATMKQLKNGVKTENVLIVD